MKVRNLLIGASMLLLPVLNSPAASAADANPCNVKLAGIIVSQGTQTATATFIVDGPAGCESTASMASWKAPKGVNGFQPYKAQTLFDSKAFGLKPGTHKVSVKIADCLYQVDAVRGVNPTNNGTADYFGHELYGWVQGGDKVCEDPKPPVTPPAPTPPAPTPPVVQAAAPAAPVELPKTGAGETAAVFAAVAAAGALLHRKFSRRALSQS